MLYITSSIAQIYSLYRFMGYDYLFYGIRSIPHIYSFGNSNVEYSTFPRVTMCDFEVRTFAKSIPYTVQCNLPINIFNAKIFLIVWYWVAIVAILNVVVFINQLMSFTAKERLNYIKRELQAMGVYSANTDKLLLHQFVFKYLSTDGYLVMKLLACNANDLATAGVIEHLWTKYKNENLTPQYDKPSPTMPIGRRKQCTTSARNSPVINSQSNRNSSVIIDNKSAKNSPVITV